MLGLNYGRDGDPLAILRRRERGAISVYAQGDDYHDIIKPRLKALARWLIAQARRRREGVRRYRGRDGEAAGGRGRTRLAGQAHQSGFAPIRLVAVPRRDLHHARPAPRRSRSRTTAAAVAPASTSARRRPSPRPIGSMRGAASPISPSSTRDRSRASCAPRWATASTAATTASRCARGTSSRRPAARRSSPRATQLRRPRLAELAAARRRGVPQAVREIAGQAHRTRSLRAQRADRDRQFRRCDARAEAERLLMRSFAAGARRRGVGAGAARPRAARRAGGRAASAGKPIRRSPTNGRRRSRRKRRDAGARLSRARLLRAALCRGIRRALRPHHRHHAAARSARTALGRERFGGRTGRDDSCSTADRRRPRSLDAIAQADALLVSAAPAEGRDPVLAALRSGDRAGAAAFVRGLSCRRSVSTATAAAPGSTKPRRPSPSPARRGSARIDAELRLAGAGRAPQSAGRDPAARRHLRPGAERHGAAPARHACSASPSPATFEPHPRLRHRAGDRCRLRAARRRLFNIVDDEPASPSDQIAFAASAPRHRAAAGNPVRGGHRHCSRRSP